MGDPVEHDSAHRTRLEHLWHDHYDDLFAYACRRADKDVAADAVADAFLVAWRRLDQVPTHPLPWLIGVTRRCLANRARSGRRLDALRVRLRSVRPETAPDPAERGDVSALAAAFRKLSPKDREAIALAAWEELTPRAAAEAMGCTLAAYKVRLHRARTRLQAHLDSAHNDSNAPLEEAT